MQKKMFNQEEKQNMTLVQKKSENINHKSDVADSALYRIKDLSAICQVSIRTLWRAKAQGLLPPEIYIGGCLRFRGSDIAKWISSGCPPKSQFHKKY